MLLVLWLNVDSETPFDHDCGLLRLPAAAVLPMKPPSPGPEMSDPTSELTAQMIEQGGRNLHAVRLINSHCAHARVEHPDLSSWVARSVVEAAL
jgi:hypothetical protein